MTGVTIYAPLRWRAVITYRTENGPVEVDHHFDELAELHDLVERGPDWNSIIRITVNLNDVRHPDITVEQAEAL